MSAIIREEQIGPARLILGDCLDVLPLIGKVDAVVTDPPYGIGASEMTLGKGKKAFHRGEWDRSRPNLKPLVDLCVPLCVWGGNYFSDVLPPTNDWLIWHKVNDGRSFSECEMAWTNFGKQTRHLSHHWGGEDKVHPTQKPLDVMLWSVGFAANYHVIFDPFMGSGTTGVASIRHEHGFIGIEREPKYFDIAVSRIRRAWQDKQSEIKFEPEPAAVQLSLMCE